MKRLVIIPFLTTFLLGCEFLTTTDSLTGVHIDTHPVKILPLDGLPLPDIKISTADTVYSPFDEDSIEMTQYREGRYYHPVAMLHRCQTFIGRYLESKDVNYLQRAEKYIAKLLSLALEDREALFLPYMFRFSVHGDSSVTMEPPWVSGMAQGEFLTVLSRLYEITGNREYLESAGKVLRSILNVKDTLNFWVSHKDSTGYFWIEEYPHPKSPGHTLNGFIFAIIGVYDYYRVTRDAKARLVYNASLTTLKHYLLEFRRRGNTSLYCLGHHHPANQSYHRLHITQFRQLSAITGDPYYSAIADLFELEVGGKSQ